MTDAQLPLLIEAEQLQAYLESPDILIVDLCNHNVYAQTHIPGSVHLDYAKIVAAKPPVMGLLPDAETLRQLFSSMGLTPEKHVVAYDDEGGGRSARLIWTLDAVGHTRYSMLNGGLHAWLKEARPTVNTEHHHPTSEYPLQIDNTPVANRNYILSQLEKDDVVLLDSRSPEEYRGEKKLAAHAGHIPGAVNMDWFLVMDKERNMRLRPEAELRKLLTERGISKDKTVVTYCQTHHRSALTYFVLKLLGYPNIKGYPGSWSDWGNSDDTPIATG